jgi:hypothetical protein
MPRSRFNNNIISTAVPISHFYLGDDETDYLGKLFTGEVESVRLTFVDQYGRTRDLQCEIAEDVDFRPHGVVLLEHQSKQSYHTELMNYH